MRLRCYCCCSFALLAAARPATRLLLCLLKSLLLRLSPSAILTVGAVTGAAATVLVDPLDALRRRAWAWRPVRAAKLDITPRAAKLKLRPVRTRRWHVA